MRFWFHLDVTNLRLMIVFGTRPEIIKMSSVIEACEKFKVDYFLVHTNQHFDENMSHIFLRELGIPQPKYSPQVGSGTHGERARKFTFRVF